MGVIETTRGEAYTLSADAGISDFWWPFGPDVDRYTFKVSGEQTEGRLVQLVGRANRGGAPPLHVHHDADETWYVLDGRLTVFVGDETIEAGPGDFVLGPMGVPHTFLVTSDQAEFLVTFSPAGTRGPSGYGVEGFFQDAAVPVVAGEAAPEPSEPDPVEFGRQMLRYGIEMVGPPPNLD
jgi:mannose-6-phosphate isomerase-like protein (cupin superfamily)